MSSFELGKVGQHPGGVPQLPAPAAQPDGAFPPAYEEAVNANLRSFDQLEGYAGQCQDATTREADRRESRRRNCFVFSFVLLIVLVPLISGWLVASHDNDHSVPSNSTTSVTITKRYTVTSTETLTFLPSVPPAIAEAASSFYEGWSSSSAKEKSIVSERLISTSTTSISLPSINMSPTSSILDRSASTTAASTVSSTTSSATSSTPSSSVDPLGDGFCGLPGTFCGGGKRDAPALDITTVTKHLTITTTSITSTTAPIPASLIAAAEAYYQEWSSSFFSTASTTLQEVASASNPTSTAPLPSLPPVTVTVTPQSALSSTNSGLSEPTSFVTCVRGAMTVAEGIC